MKRPIRASLQLAHALLFCLAVAIAPASAQTGDLVTWREAGNVPELVGALERWLDDNSDYPRRVAVPEIRWIGAEVARALSGSRASAPDSNPRGFYDADRQLIRLVRPWSPRDPHDVSVLLHELAHHRQAEAGHWYCPGAQELSAYRLQQAWLAESGLEAKVNWIAVVLEAGCSRRDFHPD